MQHDGRILITNGRLVIGDTVRSGEILIDEGKIEYIGSKASRRADATFSRLDAGGLYVGPGFIDLQVNGGDGYHFLNANTEEIRAICSFHAAHGTTGLLATLVTAPIQVLRDAMGRLTGPDRPLNLLGLHLEGPFIAETRKGAHNEAYILPPRESNLLGLVRGFERDLRMVTLAPEIDGAHAVERRILEMDAVLSLGHSDATYDEAMKAYRRGVRSVTHIFNGMREFHHRAPGAVGAAIASDVVVGVIADGIHVHPSVVRCLWRAKGPDELYLISDSIAAAGLGDGCYTLSGLDVMVSEGCATLTDGTLAGSTLTMEIAVRNLIEYAGITLCQAIRAATANPARLIGLDRTKGVLKLGMDADLVVFDDSLRVRFTLNGGQRIYDATATNYRG